MSSPPAGPTGPAAAVPGAAEVGVVLVTGVMAAGKSTVAQLLAERFERAAHVRGDVFRRFVITGRVDLTPPLSDSARVQLLLRYRLAMAAADAYVAAGFVAVVQDVVVGPLLADAIAMITTRPRHVIVLDPAPAVVATREQQRPKTGYRAAWEPAGMVELLRTDTPRLGLWLDSSQQTPAQTVETILHRLDEARVDEVPLPR